VECVNLGSSNNIVFEHDFLGQYVLPIPERQQHICSIDIVELGSSGKNFIPQIRYTNVEYQRGWQGK